MKRSAVLGLGVLAVVVAACSTGTVTTWRGVDYKKLPTGLCAEDGSPVAWQKASADGTFPAPKNINAENCPQ
ncbi:MAG: hypothetical protein RID42_00710 [Alphaproteobacteria bacterium]